MNVLAQKSSITPPPPLFNLFEADDLGKLQKV